MGCNFTFKLLVVLKVLKKSYLHHVGKYWLQGMYPHKVDNPVINLPTVSKTLFEIEPYLSY